MGLFDFLRSKVSTKALDLGVSKCLSQQQGTAAKIVYLISDIVREKFKANHPQANLTDNDNVIRNFAMLRDVLARVLGNNFDYDAYQQAKETEKNLIRHSIADLLYDIGSKNGGIKVSYHQTKNGNVTYKDLKFPEVFTNYDKLVDTITERVRIAKETENQSTTEANLMKKRTEEVSSTVTPSRAINSETEKHRFNLQSADEKTKGCDSPQEFSSALEDCSSNELLAILFDYAKPIESAPKKFSYPLEEEPPKSDQTGRQKKSF